MARVDTFLLHILHVWRKPTPKQRVVAGIATVAALLCTVLDALSTGRQNTPEMLLVLLPVLMGAFFFDEMGGLSVGVAAGLTTGPFLPEPTVVWVTRLAFFTFLGLAGGKLSHLLKRALSDSELRERQWRALSASMGDGVFLVDTEGRLVYMNPEAERLTGWTLAELKGKRIHDILRVADPAGPVSRVDRDTFTRKDGTPLPVSYTSTSVHMHRMVTGSVSVFRDMTEARRMEEALQFEADMNAQLVSLSKQMEAALSKELEISNAIGELSSSLLSQAPITEVAQRVLEHAKCLTGSTTGFAGYFDRTTGKLMAPTLLEESVWSECNMCHRDLSSGPMGGLCGMVLSRREAVLANDVATDPRAQGIPEGHLPIRRFLSVPVMSEGKVLGQIAVANSGEGYTSEDQKVLERLAALYAVAIQRAWDEESVRDSEVKFRESFHRASDALFLHEINADGSHGRILEVNDVACVRLGYSREQLLAMTSADLHLREEHEQVMRHVTQDLRLLGTATYEVIEVARDGTRIASEVSSHVFSLGGRKVALSAARDIRRRKETEEALIAAKEEAEAANRAKSEFLSRTSHELRTPLNAILGFAQLLLMDPFEPLTDSQRESLEQIHLSGRHLLELINDVLDLARIETGRVKVELDEVDATAIIGDVVGLVTPQAQARSITLTVAPQGESQVVMADQTRLRQVLLNLLTNAVKYNHEGGFVRVEAAPQSAGYLRISVADNGPGIALEEQAAIFEPFYRSAATAEVEGVGIGLALTRALVDLMGGRIDVVSTPGEGSTFWVDLPLVSQAAERTAAPAAMPAAAAPAPEAGVHTILYVEDNPSSVALMERVVAMRSGLRLITAGTAEEGFALALRHAPDLLLLDINLPDADGYTLLKRLRSTVSTWRVPAVAVSAAARPQDIERGLAAGFAAYLTKPVDVPHFLAVVDGIFGAAAEEANHV